PPPYRVRRAYSELKPNFPIAVVHQPGSDRQIVVTETWPYGPTAIQRFKDEAGVREMETLLKLDGVAYDVLFHPDFLKNGFVYVGWNGLSSARGAEHKTRVTRYKMDPKPPYTFDPSSAKEIISWHSDGHNGGALAFGHDGMLYVTSGDGTSDS